jgi:hypothetical protein
MMGPTVTIQSEVGRDDQDAPERHPASPASPSPVRSTVKRFGLSLGRPLATLRGLPNALTYAGVLLAAVGGIFVAVAWGKTAGLTNVALQIPYLISAGLTGVALVAIGMTMVNVAARRADAEERRRQSNELRDMLADIRRSLEGDVR